MTAGAKRFPGHGGSVLVPSSSRRAALAGLALYPACRPRALLVQWAARAAIGVLGPRALLGRAAAWQPPLDPAAWGTLRVVIEKAAGAWDECAVLERPQPRRAGFALLALREGRPIAFAKVRPEGEALDRESRALERVREHRPKSFLVPEPLWRGTVDGWHALVTDVVLTGFHTPAGDVDPRIVADEVSAALEGLPRPADASPSWRPMHGDLTPWNLRRRRDGRLALVDWESAGWGPPGADVVLYRASLAAVRGVAAPFVEPGWAEAVEHWRDTVALRGEGTRDRRLAAALKRVLGAMASPGEVPV